MEFGRAALEHALAAYGYEAVFLVIFLEAMGVPAPGESMVVAAAIYAGATHRLGPVGVVCSAGLGAILGDNAGYAIGRWLGMPLLHRHGRRIGLTQERLDLARWLFSRQGGKIVFFGRFVAILRTFVAIFAGANAMDWRRFLAWNVAGGIVWASLYGGAAYVLGNTMRRLQGLLGIIFGIGAIAVVISSVVVMRRQERRLLKRARHDLGSAES